ncbi:hypothetical protein XCR1_1200031 [Xenorhabdus cabanillasii JM26]|uniref:CN hydrolase domain-containing protein n=1 Tax=Xenorhabdus cabanillasii JM26 TaxID=1427517 RepID=W1IPX1_9GAMM|nr:aliphatic nitrilase [Xenorhabdus cabanillasii JM26]CDL79676.1 hypothetical protein XCR1_1200031 [Xenorhabdus cabanillasii JM26]
MGRTYDCSTNSAFTGIIGPDGRVIGHPLIDKEGIVYAEIDLNRCIQPRQMHDITGYYNRFDIFDLTVNRRAMNAIQFTLRTREKITPERFTFHSSRMRMKTVRKDELVAMDADSDRCALELSDASVDIVGVPVISASVATTYVILKQLGLGTFAPGFGSLLS